MVSAKVFGTAEVNMRAEHAAKRSAKASDDFTRTLDNSMKASDERLSKNNTMNDKKVAPDEAKSTVSDKTERLKKLFDKSEPAQTNGVDESSMKDALETVAQYSTQLVKELAAQFNVSEETVSETIESLGFEEVDLLEIKNVIDVMSALSDNKDMTQLLLDEDLSSMITDFKQQADNVVRQLESFHLTKEMVADFKNADVSQKATDLLQAQLTEDMQAEEEVSLADTGATVTKEELVQTQANVSEQSSERNPRDNGRGEHTPDMQTVGVANLHQELLNNIGEVLEEQQGVSGSGLSERIFGQILEGISANMGPDTTSIELQLNPESLGRVSITVSSKDGVLTAQIAAQNQVAKEAIESQIAALKQSFEEQGLRVEEVEITLASRQFDQNLDKEGNRDDQNRPRRGRHLTAEQLEELTGVTAPEIQEDVAVQMHKEQGNTVSYTA